MGTGASRLSGVSHDRLLQSTRQPREFFDELFQIFLKYITPDDLLKLSNPSECQKYVFVMADAIQSTFDALKLTTTKDKRGVILFQKTSELIKDSALHRDNCVAVAYFYIRLFQILGAIMLTCVDTPKASAVRGVYDVRGETAVRAPQAGPRFFRGGALKDSEYFKGFSTYGDSIRYSFKKSIIPPVKDKLFDYTLNIPIDSIENDDMIKIGSITLIKELYVKNANESNYKKLIEEINTNTPKYVSIQSLKKKGSTVKSFFDGYINAIGNVLVGKYEVGYIKRLFGKQEEYGYDYKAPDIAAGPGVRRNSVGSIQALSTQYIQDLLKNKDYNQVSLCVARGIQLLGADSIHQVQKVVHSDICKTKLDNSPKALPVDGNKLATYEPVRVLDQLYYDKPSSTVRDGSKVGSTIQVSNQAEYNDFLKKMNALFGTVKEGTTSVNKFEDITISPKCKKTKGSSIEIKEPAKIRKLTEAVSKLFAFQSKHTQEMYKFIQARLIIYHPTKGFAIHPSLLVGGVDSLNKLTVDVRQRLVNYYSMCEETYKVAAADVQL